MKRLYVTLGIVIGVFCFAWFIWPTEWTYSEMKVGEKGGRGGQATIVYRRRANRLTGELQYYDGYYWRDCSP